MDYNTLLHPYRFLIVASLAEKEASVKELAVKLPDIPQAAMYRSIQKLEEAKLIQRISERKVRGAIEATYGLNFSMEKMRMDGSSVGAYLNAAYCVFFSYVHHKLAEHGALPSRENELRKSKFNTVKIHIPEEKTEEFVQEVASLLQKYGTHEGNAYQLTTFLVPEANGGE
jgi:HxlR-like helix-turn-helix.